MVTSPVPVLKRDGVAVLAPCADCSHAAVCSIRPTLEGKGLDTDFSSSIAGVRVVAVSLECSFFLPAGVAVVSSVVEAVEDDDVVAALLALGYKTTEARQLARRASGSTVEDRLRSALRGTVAADAVPPPALARQDAPEGVTTAVASDDAATPASEPARPSADAAAAWRPGQRKLPADPIAREALILAALRSTRSTDDAAGQLGVSPARVQQLIRALRDEGRLPPDIDRLLQNRGGRRAEPRES